MQKASDSLYNSGSIQHVFQQLILMSANVIGLAAYSALIYHISPWLVAVLAAMTLAAHFVNRTNNNWYHRHKDDWAPIDKKRPMYRGQPRKSAVRRIYVCIA